MNQAFKPRRGQSGNAIWFVLLVIALLAALTLTITHFSDTAQQTGTVELDRIHASSILRYAKSLDQAISQMQGRNVSVNDINFDNAIVPTVYANPNCTKSDCKLFDTGGGGETYTAPDASWLDSAQSAQAFYGQWVFTGKLCVQGVGDETEAPGASCASNGSASDDDLVVLLPYVSASLCAQLNNMLGVGVSGAAPPVTTGAIWVTTPYYTGMFADGTNIGVSNATLYRQPSGCIEGAGTPPSGTYVFYHVLVAR